MVNQCVNTRMTPPSSLEKKFQVIFQSRSFLFICCLIIGSCIVVANKPLNAPLLYWKTDIDLGDLLVGLF